MDIGQTLDIQSARFISNEDPIPGGTFNKRLSDQLLIDKPWFDRAKVPYSRTGNRRNLGRNLQFTASNSAPMREIDRLFQQPGSIKIYCRLLEQLAPRIQNDIGGCK